MWCHILVNLLCYIIQNIKCWPDLRSSFILFLSFHSTYIYIIQFFRESSIDCRLLLNRRWPFNRVWDSNLFVPQSVAIYYYVWEHHYGSHLEAGFEPGTSRSWFERAAIWATVLRLVVYFLVFLTLDALTAIAMKMIFIQALKLPMSTFKMSWT